MMDSIVEIWLRKVLLILGFSVLVGLISLEIISPENNLKPQFATLDSKTLVLGKPLIRTRTQPLQHLASKIILNHYQLETIVIKQTQVNKGLIAQTYQQTPFSLALIALQETNEIREQAIDVALNLTPTNHWLQALFNQTKLE